MMKERQEPEQAPARVPVEDADDSSRSSSQKDKQDDDDEIFQEEGQEESKQDENSAAPKEAKSNEDRIILRLKILALVVLSLAAAGLGLATYFVTRNEEEHDFESDVSTLYCVESRNKHRIMLTLCSL